MKRERLKKIEAKVGPEAWTCILFDRSDDRPSTIRCPHIGREMNLEDCQGLADKCPHSRNFVHVIWDMGE